MPAQPLDAPTARQVLALAAVARAGGGPVPWTVMGGRTANRLWQAGLIRVDPDNKHCYASPEGLARAAELGLACLETRPHFGHEGCVGSARTFHPNGRVDSCHTRTGCVLMFAHEGDCFLTRRVVHA